MAKRKSLFDSFKKLLVIALVPFCVACCNCSAVYSTVPINHVVTDSVDSYQITEVIISEEAIIYTGLISFHERRMGSSWSCILDDDGFLASSDFNLAAMDTHNGTDIATTGLLTHDGKFSFYFDSVDVDLTSFKNNPDAYLISTFLISEVGMTRTDLVIYSSEITYLV